MRLVSSVVRTVLSGHIFDAGDRRTIADMGFAHHQVRGQMETPQYGDINDAELRKIEAEFGHPVMRELAQWFIRNRINREAVERMLGATESNQTEVRPNVQRVHKISRRKATKAITAPKKRCA